MEYLGELGRLVGLRCASTEQVQSSARYGVATTVEGRRRAQIVPAMPRTWGIDWDLAYPGEVATVDAFASGGWGPGPWHWVSVLAQHGNMLTPREALLLDRSTVTGLADGPPVVDASGAWSPRSLNIAIAGTAAVYIRGVPVIPGMPVTYSADVARRTGTPGLTVGFYNATGGSAGALAGYGAAASGMQRVSVSGVAPAGAVSMGLGVRTEVARLTRPQVTWTPGPVPYSAGHGCRSAIVDGVSDAVLLSVPGRTFTSTGFTVMEVG